MIYSANRERYNNMQYNKCGNSGIKLPAVSLGLWHNFGDVTLQQNSRDMLRAAFDLGINHFDLANNYGPPSGSAEETFATLFKKDFQPYRDELLISTKAGYDMWEGPYGSWGSKKHLVSSIDQSLKRMGLEYVDIFYHHRPDPNTPLEETMKALDYIVRSGRALYIGLSNYYTPKEAKKAFEILKSLGTPCLIHQVKYNMMDRRLEDGLADVNQDNGVGCITFSPLEKGILTNRYIKGIPSDSRIATDNRFLKSENITNDLVKKIVSLNNIAEARNQSLAQMALAWNLRHKSVTSVLIGASKVKQIEQCAAAINNTKFSSDELKQIDKIIL